MLHVRYWYTERLSVALCNLKSCSLMKQSVIVLGMYFPYKEHEINFYCHTLKIENF